MRVFGAAAVIVSLACTPPPPGEPYRAGEQIGAWRVVRSDIRRDPVEDGWTGEVVYSGETSVSGTFQAHPDSEFPALCFFVDEADRGLLPRFPNDVRRPWFCFDNEDAVRRVAKAGERATIRVSDYHYRYSHTDVYNTVKFVGIEPAGA